MPYNYASGQTQTIASISNYTATISNYDGVNKIAYLDSPINVSLGYNTTLGMVGSTYNIIGNIATLAEAVVSGTGLPGLSTDEAGNFHGIFNVPPAVFQTGSRVFRVDNRTVTTDQKTATCYAEATFTASGLSAQSTQANFSPSTDSSSTTFTSVASAPQKVVSTITTYSPYDPIAQSFIIDPTNYPNGVFLKSVKIFFCTKPVGQIPVTLSIVPTLNGIPSGATLDYSTVTLQANQINQPTSNPHYLDSTTYTEFMFSAPVYVQSGMLYAFLLRANSPLYTVYMAEQNSIAIPSTVSPLPSVTPPASITKIGAAPYVGSLFESQNAITWTAEQSKDLMFVITQCVFDITQKPSIDFNVVKGLPARKLSTNDIQHKIDASVVNNTMGNFTQNMRSDAYNVTTTDFTPTATKIGYQYNSTLAAGNIPIGPFPIIPGKFGCPTPTNIDLDDGLGERLLISTSDTSFSLSAALESSDPNVSPIISDDGMSLFNIRYMINNMGILHNVIAIANTGVGYSNSTCNVYVSMPDVGTDRAVLTANLTSNGAISTINVISPGSGYLTSPIITVYGANTIQASVIASGETGQSGGNSYSKYLTKKVVMTPGNDSGDLRVYYTAYKPTGTGVYVYYKILNSNDTQTFDSGSWQLMTQITGTTNTFSSSKSDLIEFECAPGLNGMANNSISYTNTSGQSYNSFIQFAIKVVLASSDNTVVPLISDIRALALPPGTHT